MDGNNRHKSNQGNAVLAKYLLSSLMVILWLFFQWIIYSLIDVLTISDRTRAWLLTFQSLFAICALIPIGVYFSEVSKFFDIGRNTNRAVGNESDLGSFDDYNRDNLSTIGMIVPGFWRRAKISVAIELFYCLALILFWIISSFFRLIFVPFILVIYTLLVEKSSKPSSNLVRFGHHGHSKRAK